MTNGATKVSSWCADRGNCEVAVAVGPGAGAGAAFAVGFDGRDCFLIDSIYK